MALVTLTLNPTESKLKVFALACLVMSSAIGGALFALGKISGVGIAIFAAVGIVIYALSRISVHFVKPVYWVLTVGTFPIGWVVSHAIMAVFYYGILSVFALFFRLVGRDTMCRAWEPEASSYWTAYRHKRSDEDYFRQS